MKTKEELAIKYSSQFDFAEDSSPYTDFLVGYEAGQPKWINAETLPEDDRVLIIKTFDYRRPKENVTDVTLGYFENGIWFYEEGGGIVDEGNGWHIIQWMEIPQQKQIKCLLSCSVFNFPHFIILTLS